MCLSCRHSAAAERKRVSLSLISGVTQEAAVAVLDSRGPSSGSGVRNGCKSMILDLSRLRRAWPALLRWLRLSRPAVVLSTFGHVNLALLAMRPLLRGRHAGRDSRGQYPIAQSEGRTGTRARAHAPRLSTAIPHRRLGAVSAPGDGRGDDSEHFGVAAESGRRVAESSGQRAPAGSAAFSGAWPRQTIRLSRSI